MPCTDGSPYEFTPIKYHGLTGSELEAALCAIMTVLEDASSLGGVTLAGNCIGEALTRADWKEAGVTRKQVTDWWNAHKAADQERRRKDTLERLRASGLAKLTLDEKIALGAQVMTKTLNNMISECVYIADIGSTGVFLFGLSIARTVKAFWPVMAGIGLILYVMA